jgi:hypothetical protein
MSSHLSPVLNILPVGRCLRGTYHSIKSYWAVLTESWTSHFAQVVPCKLRMFLRFRKKLRQGRILTGSALLHPRLRVGPLLIQNPIRTSYRVKAVH